MVKKPQTDLPFWQAPDERHGDYRERQVVELSVRKLKRILEHVEELQDDPDRDVGEHASVNVVGHPRPDMEKWGFATIHESDFPGGDSEIMFLDHILKHYEDVEPGDRIQMGEYDAFPSMAGAHTAKVCAPFSPNTVGGSQLRERDKEED